MDIVKKKKGARSRFRTVITKEEAESFHGPVFGICIACLKTKIPLEKYSKRKTCKTCPYIEVKVKKSRLQLDDEINQVIHGKDMQKVKSILVKKFKVEFFYKLTVDQLEAALEILKDAVYKGQL